MTRLLFMRRLYRLVGLRAEPNLSVPERRLVDLALYSTYWDCVRLGLRAYAVAVVEAKRQP